MYNWNPQGIADLATELSKIGNEYRSIMAGIYRAFNNIGVESQWTGKNYNRIADIFNQTKATFEGWAEYLQVDAPKIIFYDVAVNYSKAGEASEEIYFSIALNSDEIQNVENTTEHADGSQRIEPNTVRAIVSRDISQNFEIANEKLRQYYNQFNELAELEGEAAVVEIQNQLDDILKKAQNIVMAFGDDVGDVIEKSIQNIELTNEETINMARQLEAILTSK